MPSSKGNAIFNYCDKTNSLDFPDLLFTVFMTEKGIALGRPNIIRDQMYFSPDADYKVFKS